MDRKIVSCSLWLLFESAISCLAFRFGCSPATTPAATSRSWATRRSTRTTSTRASWRAPPGRCTRGRGTSASCGGRSPASRGRRDPGEPGAWRARARGAPWTRWGSAAACPSWDPHQEVRTGLTPARWAPLARFTHNTLCTPRRATLQVLWISSLKIASKVPTL